MPERSPLFVGRVAELRQLEAALASALAGRGRLVMVTGEAGIGKTRLTNELSQRARERGAAVLIGRCYEGEGAPPYWPWVQVVRALIADREPHQLLACWD